MTLKEKLFKMCVIINPGAHRYIRRNSYNFHRTLWKYSWMFIAIMSTKISQVRNEFKIFWKSVYLCSFVHRIRIYLRNMSVILCSYDIWEKIIQIWQFCYNFSGEWNFLHFLQMVPDILLLPLTSPHFLILPTLFLKQRTLTKPMGPNSSEKPFLKYGFVGILISLKSDISEKNGSGGSKTSI